MSDDVLHITVQRKNDDGAKYDAPPVDRNERAALVAEQLAELRLPAWKKDYSEVLHQFVADLAPLLDTLHTIESNHKWNPLYSKYEKWGGYGWAVWDGMPDETIRNPPGTQEEADSTCFALLSMGEIKEVLVNIKAGCDDEGQFAEIFDLFYTGHYQACALLMCAFIDGHLIRRCKRKKYRRSGRCKTFQMKDDAKQTHLYLAAVKNYSKVYDHFFQDGGDFWPEREGEFNRNYLAHGMATKKATRQICIKLFLLLDATIRLTA